MSNLNCQPDAVFIYDSLYRELPVQNKTNILSQISCMLMSKNPLITLLWADVQNQEDDESCGYFAIATASALCENKDPQKYTWKKQNMKEHLRNCFKTGNISLFPHETNYRKNDSPLISREYRTCKRY